jgi:hypothetical protein
MFADLNRQLAREVVAMFRHDKPLYHRDGDRWRRFDAIREPFEPDGFDGAGRRVATKRVDFQVTGEAWSTIDAATKGDTKRCIIERDGDRLIFYAIDKKHPFEELTGDRHAVRIHTVIIQETKADDDFTGRIVPDP